MSCDLINTFSTLIQTQLQWPPISRGLLEPILVAHKHRYTIYERRALPFETSTQRHALHHRALALILESLSRRQHRHGCVCVNDVMYVAEHLF